MCLIAVAFRAHPRYDLVVAANRDEFHDRPAAPAAYWTDAPNVFAGRDLKQGGAWLAISTNGRLAAVTNVRRMVTPDPKAPSRGGLVASFVRSGVPAATCATALAGQATRYAGFNLLLYDGRELQYLNNHPAYVARAVESGLHVVSNADLDTPWPKTRRLRKAMEDWISAGADSIEPLFAALADRTRAPDGELPDTGVGVELERMLSPAFIASDGYGTRCSTVVTIGKDGAIEFVERRFGRDGAPAGETRQALARR
jgi:uncharacterized protein with NRDE domain